MEKSNYYYGLFSKLFIDFNRSIGRFRKPIEIRCCFTFIHFAVVFFFVRSGNCNYNLGNEPRICTLNACTNVGCMIEYFRYRLSSSNTAKLNRNPPYVLHTSQLYMFYLNWCVWRNDNTEKNDNLFIVNRSLLRR